MSILVCRLQLAAVMVWLLKNLAAHLSLLPLQLHMCGTVTVTDRHTLLHALHATHLHVHHSMCGCNWRLCRLMPLKILATQLSQPPLQLHTCGTVAVTVTGTRCWAHGVPPTCMCIMACVAASYGCVRCACLTVPADNTEARVSSQCRGAGGGGGRTVMAVAMQVGGTPQVSCMCWL